MEILASIAKILGRLEYKDTVAERLSKAVQIPTVVGDGMGHVGEDPEWEIFYQFTKYLQKSFPLV
jgi:Gly-Xaa carboxypeptidase